MNLSPEEAAKRAAAHENVIARHTDEEILQDILRDFNPRGDVLNSWQVAFCTSLREWKARQNPARLRGHCSDDEFEATLESITSEPLVECMVHLAWVLYYRHMPQRGQPGVETVEDRLVCAHRLWCSIQAIHRAGPAGTFFTMPLVLLSVRFSMERLFKNMFPIWFDTADGVGTLEAMTLSITAVCDPAGYYAWLPALVSNRSALHVLQSSRHQRDTHQPPTFHCQDTSPVLRLGLGSPVSAGARRVMERPEALMDRARLGARAHRALVPLDAEGGGGLSRARREVRGRRRHFAWRAGFHYLWRDELWREMTDAAALVVMIKMIPSRLLLCRSSSSTTRAWRSTRRRCPSRGSGGAT